MDKGKAIYKFGVRNADCGIISHNEMGITERRCGLDFIPSLAIFWTMTTRVAVAVIRKDKTILLCQRKKGARYELKWEFPGGKLELGETVLQCLARELKEELSIEITGVDKLEMQTAEYDDGGRYEVAYCFLSAFSGEPKNNVFETIKWVTLEELRSLDILEGNKTFIAQLTHE